MIRTAPLHPLGPSHGFAPALFALLLLTAAGVATAGETGADASPRPGAVRVGDPAPDFTLRSSVGVPHSLGGRRGQGPVVLVFFRGTW